MEEWDEVDKKVKSILKDYSNLFYVSSIVVQELLQLHRIGKFRPKRIKSKNDILHSIKEAGIEIRSFNQCHLEQYAELVEIEGHKDMNDHAIIAQAISDKIPIISSDSKFYLYEKQGLELIFNKR
jgi:PIN domain nuclease of toxin-antitoxin system